MIIEFPSGVSQMQLDNGAHLNIETLSMMGQRGRNFDLLPVQLSDMKKMLSGLRGVPRYWAMDKETGTLHLWPSPAHTYKVIATLKKAPPTAKVKRDVKTAADSRA